MSGIIKAGQRQSGADACQSVAFNLEDISSRANHYLDAVRRQAAHILSEAKQQAKQLEERAARRDVRLPNATPHKICRPSSTSACRRRFPRWSRPSRSCASRSTPG